MAKPSVLTTSVSASQRPSEKGSGWRYVKRSGFARGIDTQLPEGALPDGYVLEANNVVVVRGQLLRDNGYEPYLNTLVGVPMAFVVWTQADGTEHFVVITTTRLYRRAAAEWRYIEDGDKT